MKHTLLSLVPAVLLAFAPLADAKGPKGQGPKGPTIVDVAIAVNAEGPFAGQFDSLITAVVNADPIVLDTLTGNGQFTVFAPTDAAFEALMLTPEAITDLASTPEGKALLTDVLVYHVAHGRRYAADVVASSRIRVLKGGFLFQDAGVLTDNLDRTANIVVTDVEAANGVIHVIDAVVLPYAP
jgi:uncharacterized surface protein with fasciclin (FAS1) repeats